MALLRIETDPSLSQDTRILLTVSNLTHLRESSIPRLVHQFQLAFKVDMSADVQMLMDVTDQLDKILFDDYVKRKSADVAKILRKGVLGGTVNWYEAAKPTGESSSWEQATVDQIAR